MENTETCIFRYCLRGLRLISKIFITMKVSLGVPLLDLCLVTIATIHFHNKCILKIKLYYEVRVLVSGKYKNWPSKQL